MSVGRAIAARNSRTATTSPIAFAEAHVEIEQRMSHRKILDKRDIK